MPFLARYQLPRGPPSGGRGVKAPGSETLHGGNGGINWHGLIIVSSSLFEYLLHEMNLFLKIVLLVVIRLSACLDSSNRRFEPNSVAFRSSDCALAGPTAHSGELWVKPLVQLQDFVASRLSSISSRNCNWGDDGSRIWRTAKDRGGSFPVGILGRISEFGSHLRRAAILGMECLYRRKK